MRYVSRCAANRWVFNVDLKLSMLSVGSRSRRESGNEFETIGAATENDRRPNLLRRCRDMTSWCRLADRRRWRLETSDRRLGRSNFPHNSPYSLENPLSSGMLPLHPYTKQRHKVHKNYMDSFVAANHWDCMRDITLNSFIIVAGSRFWSGRHCNSRATYGTLRQSLVVRCSRQILRFAQQSLWSHLPICAWPR